MMRRIDGNDHFRLSNARGTSLRVVEGRVWITESGCGEDRFLGAGATYRVRGNGLVLVSPAEERPATVAVAEAAAVV